MTAEYINPFEACGLFTPLFRCLDQIEGLTARHKKLYGTLARVAGKSTECSPRLSWLCAEMNDDKRNVRRLLSELEKSFRLLDIDREPNRRGLPSKYKFLSHPVMTTPDLRVETTPGSAQPTGLGNAQPGGKNDPEPPGKNDAETPGSKQRSLFKSSEEEDLRETSEEKPRTRARAADPVYEHWVRVMGWRNPTLNSDRKKVLKARRLEGYTDEQLCQAIDGATRSDFHMGRDPKHPGKKNDLKTLLKDGSVVEGHIERLHSAPPPTQKIKQPSRVDGADPNEESPWLKPN